MQKAITPEVKKEIAGTEKEAGDLIIVVKDNIIIKDQSSLDQAAAVLSEVKTRIKFLETKRTGITKPILKAKREVDAFFMPAIKQYQECESVLRAKILNFNNEQQAKRIAAIKKNEFPKEKQVDMPSNIKKRKVWTFKVEDLSKVPLQYLQINESAVKLLMKETKVIEQLEVKGLKFYQEESIMVR